MVSECVSVYFCGVRVVLDFFEFMGAIIFRVFYHSEEMWLWEML